MIRACLACLLLIATTPASAQESDAPFTPAPRLETDPVRDGAVPAAAGGTETIANASTGPAEAAATPNVRTNGEPLDSRDDPATTVVTSVAGSEPAPPDAAIQPEASPPAAGNLLPTAQEATGILASHVLEPAPPEDGRTSGADLFGRLTARLSMPACPEAEAVDRWRRRYAGHPGSFSRHLAEILPLLDFVSREVEASGLPAEFAFIPIVESWYRPEAMGKGGPAGMWQMIASTARNHGIHILPGYDGRLSPVESTRAALSYLKTLHGMFGGDWQATVMAYNAGEYRLLKALRLQGNREVSGIRRKPAGLSAITYDYVAKLQALSCLLAEPGRSRLVLPTEARFQPLAPILVDKDARHVDQVAAGHGHDARILRRLNPAYRHGHIAAGAPRLLLMPGTPPAPPVAAAEAASGPTIAAATQDPGQAAADGLHEVRQGETLWSIARRYGLGLEQLRRLNRLGRGNTIHAGQRLRVLP